MLENILGNIDRVELARMEEKLSKIRAFHLFETKFLDTLIPGTSESLCKIHEYLQKYMTLQVLLEM